LYLTTYRSKKKNKKLLVIIFVYKCSNTFYFAQMFTKSWKFVRIFEVENSENWLISKIKKTNTTFSISFPSNNCKKKNSIVNKKKKLWAYEI
jgi:hypothetical protein